MGILPTEAKRIADTSGGNPDIIHLYINESHGSASDSNPGLDPSLPLSSLVEAAARLPSRSLEDIFWHVGPHSGVGYEVPEIGGVDLEGSFIWAVGDGAGGPATDAYTVVASGTVASVIGNALFHVVGGGLGTDGELVGKSIRWESSTNGNHGPMFDGQVRTIVQHTDDQIMLAAPVANDIDVTDAFEIFVPRVFFDIQGDYVSPPKWSSVGASGGGSHEGERTFGSLFALAPDPRATSGIGLVNIGVTSSITVTGPTTLNVRDTSLLIYGMHNAAGAGQGDGSGAFPFAMVSPQSNVQLGFDGGSIDGIEVESPIAGAAFGIADTAWTGWGAGFAAPDLTAYPPGVGWSLWLEGLLTGFMSGAAQFVNMVASFYGNSSLYSSDPAALIGFFPVKSTVSFASFESGGGHQLHGNLFGIGSFMVDSSVSLFESGGQIFVAGPSLGVESKVWSFGGGNYVLDPVTPTGVVSLFGPDLMLAPVLAFAGSGGIAVDPDSFTILKRAMLPEASVDLDTIGAGLDGLTLDLHRDGNLVQTVTFPAGVLSAQDILDEINNNTTGLTAVAGLGNNGLILYSDTISVSGSIQLDPSSTGIGVLGLPLSGFRSCTENALGLSAETGGFVVDEATLLDSAELSTTLGNAFGGDYPTNAARRVDY